MKNLILCLLSLPLIAIAQTGQVAGKVLDERNEPMAFAYLLFFQGENFVNGCHTDEDGNYRVEGLPEGVYTVKTKFLRVELVDVLVVMPNICHKHDVVILDSQFEDDLYEEGTTTAFEPPVFEPNPPIQLKKANQAIRHIGGIRGKVVNHNGEPLASAQVLLLVRGHCVNEAIAKEDGTYGFDSLGVGLYGVEVRYLTAVKRIENIELADEHPLDVDIHFSENELSGKVGHGSTIYIDKP